jgi:hypothetical protein
MNVTRIKFRMRINNNIYNAIEDSIYLTKNGNEFVSLIHITNKITDFVPNEILSTKETVELLKTLSENVITPVVYETESALNKVLKENNNDK